MAIGGDAPGVGTQVGGTRRDRSRAPKEAAKQASESTGQISPASTAA
jgi:hypothetical protein